MHPAPTSPYDAKPWLAHYRCAHEIPQPNETVLQRFEHHAAASASSAAIHFFDDSITFAGLNERANRFASLLAQRGIEPGDRIAISLQNNPQFLIAQFGAWKRGCIVVPLNPMLKQQELDYYLADSGARLWIGLDELYNGHARAALDRSRIEHILTTDAADPTLRYLDAVNAAPDDHRPAGNNGIAYLVYTSGTTGPPKGAICLHRNIVFNAEVYRVWMQLGHGDVILGLAPLFHITGLVAEIAAAAWAGIPLVLFHRFDAAQAIRLARRWRATFSVAAITAYIALMNAPADADTSPLLAKCYSGGAPVAPGLVQQFEQRFGCYIHNIYGLTETNSPSHGVPFGACAPIDPASGALSIGVPIPNCEARILSLDDPDREAPPGEAGELALKGPMIFDGYWNKPDESAKAFHNGFFRTGDVAIMDSLGWFYIVDRKKDMIIASGFKIWPREVEDILYQHPAVKEAAVIGVPDAYRGETVKAFVALKDGCAGTTAGELIHFCRERLANYKAPRDVEFLPELPKTATGKFMRRALR